MSLRGSTLPLARWFLVGFGGCGMLCAWSAVARAAEQPVTATVETGIREIHNLPYVTGGQERQQLDLYLPAAAGQDAAGARPLVIWFHGGGWRSGDRKHFPDPAMVRRGYVVACVSYRFSKDAVFPAQIQDAKAAVRWLRAHAAEYGIDPNRIGVWGRSAGGYLVALLGTTGNIRDFDVGENLEQSSGVQCVVDWFGPTDFVHYSDRPWEQFDTAKTLVTDLLGFPVTEHADKARLASPSNYVQKGAAPFLIVHGDSDPLVPLQQSQLLHEALRKVGVESTLEVLPGARHGGNEFGAPEQMAKINQFFDKHLLSPHPLQVK